MKELFDNVSASCSKITTKAYSTSFSLGILLLDKKFHRAIYGIYGFVRFADEIVDSFHNYDKQYLMYKFRNDTVEAIAHKISLNAILNSYQETVHKYDIEWELTDTFLKSMEMDLHNNTCNTESYKDYILGSAEVVGLMCLKVFTEGNKVRYEELKPYAMKLGAAFQKVNFLRDLKADYQILGRSYFPDIDLSDFSYHNKKQIQEEIEADFQEALIGINKLPHGSRRGVYLAYIYYQRLFSRIKKSTPENVINARIRVPNVEKIALMFQSVVRHQLNLL